MIHDVTLKDLSLDTLPVGVKVRKVVPTLRNPHSSVLILGAENSDCTQRSPRRLAAGVADNIEQIAICCRSCQNVWGDALSTKMNQGLHQLNKLFSEFQIGSFSGTSSTSIYNLPSELAALRLFKYLSVWEPTFWGFIHPPHDAWFFQAAANIAKTRLGFDPWKQEKTLAVLAKRQLADEIQIPEEASVDTMWVVVKNAEATYGFSTVANPTVATWPADSPSGLTLLLASKVHRTIEVSFEETISLVLVHSKYQHCFPSALLLEDVEPSSTQVARIWKLVQSLSAAQANEVAKAFAAAVSV